MALEFNCPYCTSAIRVKDEFAGKRGRCPRCQEQLIVPAIQSTPMVSAVPPQTESHPAARESAAHQPQPTDIAPETVPEPAGFDIPAIVTPIEPVTRSARPKRRQSNRTALIILGVCAVLVVGLAAGLYVKNQPVVLEGRLQGEFVGAAAIRPASVSIAESTEPDAVKQQVLAATRATPYSLKSSLVVTEFSSVDSSHIQVRLIPTTSTAIVRVNPASDATLANWLSEHSDRIAVRRLADLNEAANRFVSAYAAYDTDGTTIGNSDAVYYRNNLGLAATNPRFGYVVQAIASLQVCPCIYEDGVGNLYFAVPANTTEFSIVGRPLSTGKKMFEGSYTVQCSAMLERLEVVTPAKPRPGSAGDDTKSGKAVPSEAEPKKAAPSEPEKPVKPSSMEPGTMFLDEDEPKMDGSMKPGAMSSDKMMESADRMSDKMKSGG